jgi:hypothetical protein
MLYDAATKEDADGSTVGMNVQKQDTEGSLLWPVFALS